jgi:hypothetical protein
MPRHTNQTGALITLGLACVGLSTFSSPVLAAHNTLRAPHVVRHASHASRRATPPDSYLQYKVYSVDQLIEQVSGNPVVRQRFARHFQIPESRVVSYMRANLVESYIPATGRYTVYCVRRTGKFYPVKQTFRQGTKVFALRNGEPVMKWVCGNPLSHFLPSVQVRTIASKLPPVIKVSPSIQTFSPADTMDVLVPSEVTSPVYQPMVPIPTAAVSSAALGRGGASLLPFLLPAALIGIHSGSNSHFVPPAVPEANELLYLAAGIPIIGLLVRRRKGQGQSA